MILISGGGYYNCCDVDLVEKWHKELTALGVQCVNFVYRTSRPKGIPIYQTAWEDGQRAVRLVRSQARKRGFDHEKIGAIGMSTRILKMSMSDERTAPNPILSNKRP